MMKAQRITSRVKETIKKTERFVIGAKEFTQKELSHNAPKVVHALDKSMDKAGQGLYSALATINKKTGPEQLELLKSYKTFLQKQIAFVDSQIKAREKAPK